MFSKHTLIISALCVLGGIFFLTQYGNSNRNTIKTVPQKKHVITLFAPKKLTPVNHSYWRKVYREYVNLYTVYIPAFKVLEHKDETHKIKELKKVIIQYNDKFKNHNRGNLFGPSYKYLAYMQYEYILKQKIKRLTKMLCLLEKKQLDTVLEDEVLDLIKKLETVRQEVILIPEFHKENVRHATRANDSMIGYVASIVASKMLAF